MLHGGFSRRHWMICFVTYCTQNFLQHKRKCTHIHCMGDLCQCIIKCFICDTFLGNKIYFILHTLLFSCFSSFIHNPDKHIRRDWVWRSQCTSHEEGAELQPRLVGCRTVYRAPLKTQQPSAQAWMSSLAWVQNYITDLCLKKSSEEIFLLCFSTFLPISLSLPINCPFPFPPYHAFINN